MTPCIDLHELARARALRLRREAIDDFWRGADTLLARAGLTLGARIERSAQRLQARLARHARQRVA